LTSLDEVLPSWLFTTRVLDISLAQWAGLLVLAVCAVLVGSLGQWLLVRLGGSIVRRTGQQWDDQLLDLLPGPLRILLALLTFHAFAFLLQLSPAPEEGVQIGVRTLLILAVTWLVVRLITLASAVLESYLARRIEEESWIRALRTQLALPRSILRIAAVVVGVSLTLLQFDVVRSAGVSLLASAGLVGVILGLAAQRAVANLLAGIQLALAQPIKIGDVVVVENEWGWIAAKSCIAGPGRRAGAVASLRSPPSAQFSRLPSFASNRCSRSRRKRTPSISSTLIGLSAGSTIVSGAPCPAPVRFR
jgi:small-conductance mechanosensitive channel